MSGRMRFSGAAIVATMALSLAGCPPEIHATRDGGLPCTSHSDCNPGGPGCGVVRLCVQGFCTDTTSVLACRDGGYPEGGINGMCLSYVDCNPPPACGLVITCIQYMCDPTAPRIMIPCPDAGGDAEAGMDAADAGEAGDTATDASDASGMDAATE